MIAWKNIAITFSTISILGAGLIGAAKGIEYLGYDDKLFVTNEKLEKVVENLQKLPMLNNSSLLKLKRQERRQIEFDIERFKADQKIPPPVFFQQRDALDEEIKLREEIELVKPED